MFGLCTGATGPKCNFYSVGNVSVLAPPWPVGTEKQAQGCAGEGLNPEGISPRLRARLLAVTCKMLLFESLILDGLHLYFFAPGKVPVLAPSWAVGTDKQAQGCAGEGLNPEGISPRLRARMLAVTCKMSIFESII